MKNFDVKQFGKVAVLLGGASSEREIALKSGKAVLNALLNQKVDAHPVDIKDNVIQQLIKGRFDRAFNVAHGHGGEDGVIQGVLEVLGIPYTGSGLAASALAMDKVRTKWVLQKFDVPILPCFILNERSDFAAIEETFKFPICVKPVHEGSSVGVIKVTNLGQLRKAYEDDLQHQDTIMAEPWIEGREFTVAILEDTPLPVVEICPAEGFYDYQAKYGPVPTKYYCPCDLLDEDQKRLQDLALCAYNTLGCCGWARIDFLRDKQGKFWLTEGNTVPGMTERSLVPMAAKAAGIEYEELVIRILKTSRLYFARS